MSLGSPVQVLQLTLYLQTGIKCVKLRTWIRARDKNDKIYADKCDEKTFVIRVKQLDNFYISSPTVRLYFR